MEVTDQKSVPEKGSWGLLLAYVTAAVGAPSVIAVLKWSSVAAHPLLGAGLLAAAAVLIGLAGLAHEVWRRTYHDRVIDRITAAIDRRTTRFGRRYREHLLADLRFVDLKGVAGRFFDPDLSDVYVDVPCGRTTLARSPQAISRTCRPPGSAA